MFVYFFFKVFRDHRDLHLLTHSFPTRRSSDLPEGQAAPYDDPRRERPGQQGQGGRVREVLRVHPAAHGRERRLRARPRSAVEECRMKATFGAPAVGGITLAT